MICDTNCVKIAPAVTRKKRVTLPLDDTTPYASEGFFSFSSRTTTCSIWRQQSWRENDVNCDNQHRWPMTSVLDMLKETDLRVGFTEAFPSLATREILDYETRQPRLLRCLYGLGTNTGLKR